jgi:hypothetical protein
VLIVIESANAGAANARIASKIRTRFTYFASVSLIWFLMVAVQLGFMEPTKLQLAVRYSRDTLMQAQGQLAVAESAVAQAQNNYDALVKQRACEAKAAAVDVLR